ncbi:MAG: hypothetical protein RLW87_07430 [Alphaproteobacteria bacterium]|nr:hypothetical protein [Alphaproteobacteria bacterium]MEC9266331.1 hypothetical protein [Pseudomonadota bacterium]
MTSWGLGIVMALIALVGLVLAAGAADATMEWVGLLLTLFGIGYNYGLIVQNTGH